VKRSSLLVGSLIFAGAITALPAQTTNAVPATNAPPAAATPPSPVIAQSDIISKAQAFLTKYPAPPSPSVPDPIETNVRDSMAEIESELQLFSEETARMNGRTPSLDLIQSRIVLGKDLAKSPADWGASITAGTNDLDAESAHLAAAKEKWTETQATLVKASPPPPPEYRTQIAAVLARIDAVQGDLAARKNRLLQLQVQVGKDAALVSDSLAQLADAQQRARSQLVQANAPPLWSGELMPLDTSGTIGWSRQVQSLLAYVRAQPGKFLIHGLLLALLIGCFWWLRGFARRLAHDEPGIARAAGLFEASFATALLLSLAVSPLLYYPIAPRLLSALLGAVALVPCVILLRRLIEPRLFPILYALVIFYFLEEFRSVAAMPAAAARAFLLTEILGAVSFLGWVLLALRRIKSVKRISRSVRLGARAAMAVLAAGWLAEVLGFTLLANLLCVAVQRSATLALALYAGIRIVEALLFILTRLRPFSDLGMVRLHGALLLRRTQRVLVWAAAAIWVLALLEQFSLRSEVEGRIVAFFGAYSDPNHFDLTLQGKILTAIFIGWAVFQLSRFTRFALKTDFYPRLHLGAGIPYAISTSLHYALLVVAFIAGIHVLGLNMTNFTILVSALGVGVGFGLQTIINNFVSGLILLFERPVKIGDSVQVGTDAGMVERIGIRASVLRTASGSELIVPNASLISNSVTNWTLSSRERIIIIPLNVVRGPDADHLIALLTTTAAAHPKVLQEPPPQVLAQALGANLGFELRAWTRASDDWGVVRSELILAINAALAKENIALA
jgi:potassium-dependent mechanosensitive channel